MFKNISIGKKLIASFVLISLFASISGIVSVGIMKKIDIGYSRTILDYGFVQGDIGKLLSAFVRVDSNIHDSISYLNTKDADAAYNNFKNQSNNIMPYFDLIEKTLDSDEERTLFNTAKSKWDEYIKRASELVEEGRTNNYAIILKVQKDVVKDLEPLCVDIYTALSSILELKVSSGTEISDNMSSSAALGIFVSIILIIVTIIISIILGGIIARGIASPIKVCSERLQKLAKGDLNSPVPNINSKDEVGILADATNSIVSDLKEIIYDMVAALDAMGSGDFTVKSKVEHSYVGDFALLITAIRKINVQLSNTMLQINEAADQVSSGSDQVSSGAQALSQGATEQASSVQELAATINEISVQVKNNASNSKEASDKASSVGDEMEESNIKMKNMIDAISKIETSSNEIVKIIKTIEDIAFQTNILALNAAVEAARAGSAGKGFAVVADEVRNLASKSAEASKNTADLIEASMKSVHDGTAIADETAQSLLVAVDGARQVADTIDKISSASLEQADSISQITQGIDQISSVVQTNSATAEQSAAASQELSGQAQMLKNLVSHFKLKSATESFKNDKEELHLNNKKEINYDTGKVNYDIGEINLDKY